ncbi:MAG: metalloregulator ArsR/SmtB family transcription factor [Actinomycetota bacterium]
MSPMALRLIQEIDEACCVPVVAAPLGESEAERLADALKVVADPARLRLLSLLAADAGQMCVCDLTDPLALSQPTVSHHLKVLHDAGIVAREKRGRWVYYRLVPAPLELLRDAIDPAAWKEKA